MNLVPRISYWHRGHKKVTTKIRWYDLDDAEHGFPRYVREERYVHSLSLTDTEIVGYLMASE